VDSYRQNVGWIVKITSRPAYRSSEMKNSCGRKVESPVQALRTSAPVCIFSTSNFTYFKRGHMTRKRLGVVLSAFPPCQHL
jgi:hypothetical protein